MSGAFIVPSINRSQLLWKLTAANMNIDTDQAFTKQATFATYLISGVYVVNASTNLTTAVGGIYSAASKAGPLVAATQVYSGLTGGTLGILATIAALGLAVQSSTTLYLSLTVAQGGAATADFYVIGTPLS